MFGLSALTLVYEQSLHNDIIRILHGSILGACLVVSDETELLAEGGDKFAMGAGMHDGSGA